MSYILNQVCSKCGGKIRVIGVKDKDNIVVSHGECENCFRIEILPEEPFFAFVSQFCTKG